VLKPSELTPATSTLLASLIARYLDPNVITVVNGAIPETTRLLELPWAHIMYTGNGVVGRVVATAAAKHLTPVTLEVCLLPTDYLRVELIICFLARWQEPCRRRPQI
jgi:aldehyde dehydrogenase (NAD+)